MTEKINVCDHAPLLYTPDFWNPQKAYQSYTPDLASAYIEGVKFAAENGLKTAQKLIAQGKATALMATDLQNDFRESGRLPVQGADDAILRTCVRAINGIVSSKYAGIIWSQDGHCGQHISYDVRWRDEKGMPLDLREHGNAATLSIEDPHKAVFKATGYSADGPYDIGYYRSKFDSSDTVDYSNHLNDTNQGDIWVFVTHCKLGSDGVNFHPLLQEVVAFAEGALSLMPTLIPKGHIANTDWFGPLMPCRPDDDHEQGGFQEDIIKAFKMFFRIEFAGIATDFCDFYMKKQTMDNLRGTEYMEKLVFLTDCTAAIVPNADHVMKQDAQAQKDGVKFIDHNASFAEAA